MESDQEQEFELTPESLEGLNFDLDFDEFYRKATKEHGHSPPPMFQMDEEITTTRRITQQIDLRKAGKVPKSSKTMKEIYKDSIQIKAPHPEPLDQFQQGYPFLWIPASKWQDPKLFGALSLDYHCAYYNLAFLLIDKNQEIESVLVETRQWIHPLPKDLRETMEEDLLKLFGSWDELGTFILGQHKEKRFIDVKLGNMTYKYLNISFIPDGFQQSSFLCRIVQFKDQKYFSDSRFIFLLENNAKVLLMDSTGKFFVIAKRDQLELTYGEYLLDIFQFITLYRGRQLVKILSSLIHAKTFHLHSKINLLDWLLVDAKVPKNRFVEDSFDFDPVVKRKVTETQITHFFQPTTKKTK